jgi:6-phosphogluconolactonase
MPWQQVHLFWGDERHVPPDDPSSNYGMTRKTMLEKVPIPRVNVHRISAEYSDAKKSAREYEELLRRFFRLEAQELPCFDCVLLGIGPDGHTASLFPGTKALVERKRLVVANWVERLQTYRITMTVPVLNNANHVFFLAAGENKAGILQEVLEGERDPERLPSQFIEPNHGKLVWLVDEAAASELSQRNP